MLTFFFVDMSGSWRMSTTCRHKRMSTTALPSTTGFVAFIVLLLGEMHREQCMNQMHCCWNHRPVQVLNFCMNHSQINYSALMLHVVYLSKMYICDLRALLLLVAVFVLFFK